MKRGCQVFGEIQLQILVFSITNKHGIRNINNTNNNDVLKNEYLRLMFLSRNK